MSKNNRTSNEQEQAFIEIAETEKKKFKWTKGKIIGLASSVIALALVVAIMAGLVAIGAIPLMMIFGKGNDVYYKDKFTASELVSDITKDYVVATMGEYTLTNAQLRVFFWMQLYEMMDYYGQYAEYYLGIDMSKPLSEQQYNKTDMNWEQYVMSEAIASSWLILFISVIFYPHSF